VKYARNMGSGGIMCMPGGKSKAKVTLLLTVGRSVSQSVSQHASVSSTLVGLASRYYFLSECCFLKFAVPKWWFRLSKVSKR
jgi:hypothetical protein